MTSTKISGTGFFRIGTDIKQSNWVSGSVDPAQFGGPTGTSSAAITIALRVKL